MSPARTFLLATVLCLGACSRPKAPKITPISGHVASVSPSGITIDAKLEANNTNDIALDVQGLTAKLKLDNQYDAGTVTVNHPIKLPANKKTQFEVPITFKWKEVMALAPLALSNRDIPFEAEGDVKIGSDSFDVDVPFKVSGTVTHAQLQQAVGKSIPKLPAGLPLPF